MNPKGTNALNRRAFLARCGQGGVALALLPALLEHPAPQNATDWVRIPGMRELIDDPRVQTYIRNGAAPFFISGIFLNQFARNLRFENVEPSLRRYFQNAGAPRQRRTFAQAQTVWETIPPSIRAQGDGEVRRFLRGRDWSHVIAKANGGDDATRNGIFEHWLTNRARGARNMTPQELRAARNALRAVAVRTALASTAKISLVGAVAGAAVAVVLTLLEYGLQLKQGQITRIEFYQAVTEATIQEGSRAFVIAGLVLGLTLLIPELLPVMAVAAIPLAAIGFVTLGYRFYDLGQEWWEELERDGTLAQYVEAVAIAEKAMRALDMRSETGSFLDSMSAHLAEWARSAAAMVWMPPLPEVPYLGDFDAAAYLPDIPFDLTAYVPDFQVQYYLPTLQFHLPLHFPELDFTAAWPQPDFHGGIAAAQSALQNAAAYLY